LSTGGIGITRNIFYIIDLEFRFNKEAAPAAPFTVLNLDL